MELKRRGIQSRTQLLALVVVIVLMAGGFSYLYYSAQGQITSLSSENQVVCTQLYSLAGATQRFYDNLTAILRGSILNDNSLIQALNQSKPAGFTGMINLLKAQVEVYSVLLSVTSKPVSIGLNSCNGQ